MSDIQVMPVGSKAVWRWRSLEEDRRVRLRRTRSDSVQEDMKSLDLYQEDAHLYSVGGGGMNMECEWGNRLIQIRLEEWPLKHCLSDSAVF